MSVKEHGVAINNCPRGPDAQVGAALEKLDKSKSPKTVTLAQLDRALVEFHEELLNRHRADSTSV
jgi:hypothetical protein